MPVSVTRKRSRVRSPGPEVLATSKSIPPPGVNLAALLTRLR